MDSEKCGFIGVLHKKPCSYNRNKVFYYQHSIFYLIFSKIGLSNPFVPVQCLLNNREHTSLHTAKTMLPPNAHNSPPFRPE
jgi:hypothetical protein